MLYITKHNVWIKCQQIIIVLTGHALLLKARMNGKKNTTKLPYKILIMPFERGLLSYCY